MPVLENVPMQEVIKRAATAEGGEFGHDRFPARGAPMVVKPVIQVGGRLGGATRGIVIAVPFLPEIQVLQKPARGLGIPGVMCHAPGDSERPCKFGRVQPRLTGPLGLECRPRAGTGQEPVERGQQFHPPRPARTPALTDESVQLLRCNPQTRVTGLDAGHRHNALLQRPLVPVNK